MSQTTTQNINISPTSNLLDSVEEVLDDNNWIYERISKNRLLVDVAGSIFTYHLCFTWQEHMRAIQITCQFDCSIEKNNLSLTNDAIMQINKDLWMGHFELNQVQGNPCFRYTFILHNKNDEAVYANIQDVVDICFAQCERYQSVFQLLASNQSPDIQEISLAMMDTAGES